MGSLPPLTSFLENSSDYYYGLTDPECRLIAVNRKFRDTFSTGSKYFIGKSFTEVARLIEEEKCNQAARACLADPAKTFTIDVRSRYKTGNEKWFRWEISAVNADNASAPAIQFIGTDITQHKLAEDQLRQTEYSQSILLGATFEGLSLIDPSYRIIVINEAGKKVLKDCTGAEYYEGINLLDILPEERKEKIKNYLDSALRGNKHEYEINYPAAENDFWLLVTYTPAKAAGGEVTGVCMASRDITKKKKAELALQQSERQLQSLIKNIPGALYQFIYKPDGTYGFRFLSKAIENVFGPEIHEFADFFNHISPEEKEGLKKKIVHSRQTNEPFYYEVSIKAADGQVKWHSIYSSFSYEEENGIKVFTGIIQDITESKSAELALGENEKRFRLVLEKLGDNLWEHDFRTGKTVFSEAVSKLLGYSSGELSDNVKLWWESTHEDDQHLLSENDEKYKLGLITHHSLEYRVRHKDGSVKWVLDRGVVIEQNNMGRPLKIIGTHTDITEQRQAEKEMLRLQEKFSVFMQNTPALAWIFDDMGVIHYLNLPYLKALNLTEEVFGKTLFDIYPVGLAQQYFKNNLAVIIKNQPGEMIESGLRADGTTGIYHTFRFPIKLGGKPFVGGVAIDITVQEKLREKLVAEEDARKKDIIQAIINAQEKERREISYELHDNINQILAACKLYLEVAGTNPVLTPEYLKKAMENVEQVIGEVRKISHELNPSSLQHLGLLAAVRDISERLNIPGKMAVKLLSAEPFNEEKVPYLMKLAVFRIIQEQLNNILKHSGATEIIIELICYEKSLHVKLGDNGVGFDTNEAGKGIGLNNIYNRVEFYKGKLELISSPGKGCTLEIEMPLES
ncbi:MAG: PAS domain S-box protein [Chitinophagaceae bacterium]|nr:PAS domain S-box protein [Chitinophagaceae bacterium]